MKLTFACAQHIRTQIAKSFQKILYIWDQLSSQPHSLMVQPVLFSLGLDFQGNYLYWACLIRYALE